MLDPDKDVILITGAAGKIGSVVREALRGRWRHLRLLDQVPIPGVAAGREAILADILNRPALTRATEGVSALVHFAGLANSASAPDDLLRVNGLGLLNTFKAACHAGVRRIIFASSNHAFGAYPIDVLVAPDMEPRPGNIYGALKVLGETLLRHYYDVHAISSVSLRIGSFLAEPKDQRSLSTWISPRDLCQLVERSLEHPEPGCLIVNAYSDNRRLRVSRDNWDFLGYRPLDDSETFAARLQAQGIDVDGPPEWPRHGGPFVT